MTNLDDPYLSVVVTSRNDNHGGNLLARTQVFYDSLMAQCETYGLDCQIILVEWNPPPDAPSLRDALDFSQQPDEVRIDFVEVPNRIHREYRHAEHLPLYQMIAKNVGVRRAVGQFILATNIDVVLSDELMRTISSRNLRQGTMYRVNRYDVPFNPDGRLSISELLNDFSKHVARIHGRMATYIPRKRPLYSIYETLVPVSWVKANVQYLLGKGERPPFVSHTNAAGDFTLLSAEGWHRLEGYAEFEMYSFFIDAIFCHAARAAGLREKVFRDPMRAYHMDHEIGSGWSPEGHDVLMERLGRRGIPVMSYDEYLRIVSMMRREGWPTRLNGPAWGLANELLSCWTLRSGSSFEQVLDPAS